jgi:hypothetical protein
MAPLTTIPSEIPRDRWERPLVVPPGGGKAVPYTRCTTYVKCLEDTFNLERWKMRMTALGLADRPDLMLSVAAHRDDKDRLNKLTEQAMEAAKAGAAATVGTALHVLTQRHDAGQDIGVIPDAYKEDLASYERGTRRLDILGIERFTVLDDLQIGGTHDRTVAYRGSNYIADVKTGTIDWGMGTIAMQLAVYAHSVLYDHTSQARQDLPDVSLERAILIHLPAGQGACTLKWVNIAAGWHAVQLATRVRAWRKRKDLSWALEDDFDMGVFLDNLIAMAPSVEALNAIWAEHFETWTPEHTQLAAARKALLVGGLVSTLK